MKRSWIRYIFAIAKTLTTNGGVLLTALPAYGFGHLGMTSRFDDQYLQKLTTADNVEISALYIPGKNPRATIVVAPALGVPKYHYSTKFAELFPNYNLVCFDHRGQGASGDVAGIRSPVSQALTYGDNNYLDVVAAIEYAAKALDQLFCTVHVPGHLTPPMQRYICIGRGYLQSTTSKELS